MVAFAGICALSGGKLEAHRRQALERQPGRQRIWVRDTESARFVAEFPFDQNPDGAVFVSDSRLDNRSDIAGEVGLPASASESACIHRIFEQRGDVGVARLLGAFAFAHWREDSGVLTLGRDCLGQRPLFYHLDAGVVVFSNDLRVLLGQPEVSPVLNERVIADFLADRHHAREETCYAGIFRTPSRSLTCISRRGAETRPYWSPNFSAPAPYSRDADYITRGRELFDRAAKRAITDAPRAAVLLSGGLDSSGAGATVARLGSGDVDGYTGVPPSDFNLPPGPGQYLNERDKVEALGRLYPNLRNHFITPRGAHPSQCEPIRAFFATPMPARGVANRGWFAQILEAMVADGHEVVIGGGSGNLTLTYGGRDALAMLLRQGKLLRLVQEARAEARAEKSSVFSVLRHKALAPSLPTPLARFVRGRSRSWFDEARSHSLISPEIARALIGAWRKEDRAVDALGLGAARRSHHIFDSLQVARDLRPMMYAQIGLEYRSPFEDREFIEFCLQVPEDLYRRDGRPRWFARKVFADRLPPEILNETRRGEQAPNWFESLDARKACIEDAAVSAESSSLASRLIDMPRMRQLIADWPADAREAGARASEYRLALDRAAHLAQFIKWAEGGNR